ncbi:MAG: endonuclease [Bacteroidota bacterium]
MKIFLIFILLLSGVFFSFSQIPSGYYDSASGLNGLSLKIALHNIIKNHIIISYDNLHDYYIYTDKKPNGKVWDIYSDNPGGTPPYEYNFIAADQCGNYSGEGDCYNKEHTWPKSWFGGEISPMYSDLFIVYPTDGYVNGIRSNNPYGEVNSPSWTSMNGSKSGNCSFSGYSQGAFEPIDEYKGDLARTFFYISVRYYGEDGSWPGSAQTNGAELSAWALNMMYQWHSNDPVSPKETDRNNAVYQIQNNRNPFIDHPEWIDSVWHPLHIPLVLSNINDIRIFPNPSDNYINVNCNDEIYRIEIYNSLGIIVCSFDNIESSSHIIDISKNPSGYYYIYIFSEKNRYIKKITIIR